MVSPNAYNSLGLGTTQLYNEPLVYNLKRHGPFELDGRAYDFRLRPSFPKTVTPEFLLVDLLHNLGRLPEDRAALLPKALERARRLDRARLARVVNTYGSARAARLLEPVLAESAP